MTTVRFVLSLGALSTASTLAIIAASLAAAKFPVESLAVLSIAFCVYSTHVLLSLWGVRS